MDMARLSVSLIDLSVSLIGKKMEDSTLGPLDCIGYGLPLGYQVLFKHL